MIERISPELQQSVIEATARYIKKAGDLYNKQFELIPVLFDLTGRSAGMYRVKNGKRQIRYNPYIFAKYFNDNIAETVPHEVAHYVTDRLYGLRSVRPHGKEWASVMRGFGVEPKRTCQYDLDGVPVRVFKRVDYRCSCMTHQVTSRRHSQIERGHAQFACRRCGESIVYAQTT